MSDHWNSDLLNKVLTKIEAASFFKDIGRDRTLSFVRESLRLARYHDGNPGEVLAGVGAAPGHLLLLLELRARSAIRHLRDLSQGRLHTD